VERAQLETALARKRHAEQTVKRTRALAQRGGVPLAQLDADEAELASARSEVAALRAQLGRKAVTAPFAGKLGIRAVNLGQYLSPGTTITTLESLESVFVDFALPQHALSSVRPGMSVRVTLGGENPFTTEGTVAAVDPKVDESTRTIQVRASVPNRERKLRPGMFANVAVVLPGETQVVAVPATAVVHAPYGDSVFVVAPPEEAAPDRPEVKRALQRFVRLGEQRGDFVAVLEGIEAGQEVVTAGAFKLQNGAPIVVNNDVKLEPVLQPRPENR
jgi:membrane fusion protein (multidrug efflux system)